MKGPGILGLIFFFKIDNKINAISETSLCTRLLTNERLRQPPERLRSNTHLLKENDEFT